jgi:cytochrome c oxidase assembly protein subunit 15
MWKLGGIFALGGLQGFIGWYMVSSGLAERVSVSHYRLALHMTLAVAIFGAVLWVALALGRAAAAGPAPARRIDDATAAGICALVLLQVAAGALVAGLKAGSGWNTWPLMDGALIPQGVGALTPWWMNLFENALTVQFQHRLIAYAIVAAALWHAWALNRAPNAHAAQRRSAAVLVGAVAVQAGLGIWTLLAHVPIPLALLHQAGAVALLGVALWHWHGLRHG